MNFNDFKIFSDQFDLEFFLNRRSPELSNVFYNLRMGSTGWDAFAVFCSTSTNNETYCGCIGSRNVCVHPNNLFNYLKAADHFIVTNEERFFYGQREYALSDELCDIVFDWSVETGFKVNLPVSFYARKFPRVTTDQVIEDVEDIEDDVATDIEDHNLVEYGCPSCGWDCTCDLEAEEEDDTVNMCVSGIPCIGPHSKRDFCPVAYTLPPKANWKFSSGVDITVDQVKEKMGCFMPVGVSDLVGVRTLSSSDIVDTLAECQVLIDGIDVAVQWNVEEKKERIHIKDVFFERDCNLIKYDRTFQGVATKIDNEIVFVVTKVSNELVSQNVLFYSPGTFIDEEGGLPLEMCPPKWWKFLPSQQENYVDVVALHCGAPIKGLEFKIIDNDGPYYRKWSFRRKMGRNMYSTDACAFTRTAPKYEKWMYRVIDHYKYDSVPIHWWTVLRFMMHNSQHTVDFPYYSTVGANLDMYTMESVLKAIDVGYEFNRPPGSLQDLCIARLTSNQLHDAYNKKL